MYSSTHWLRPRNSPPHLGSYVRALLVSKDRHLFVTPWTKHSSKCHWYYGQVTFGMHAPLDWYLCCLYSSMSSICCHPVFRWRVRCPSKCRACTWEHASTPPRDPRHNPRNAAATVPLFLCFHHTTVRKLLILVWLVLPSLKNFTFRMNNIAINVRLELKIAWSYVSFMHKIDVACMESLEYCTEAEFLDEIQIKVLIVFLRAIHNHLYSFGLRFLFFQTHATSYSF